MGIAANGLSDLLARGKLGDSAPASGDAVEEAVKTAIKELTSVEVIHAVLGGEDLRRFLRSPEVTNVVRQLYMSSAQPKSRAQIEQEFLELWNIWPAAAETSREEVARLFGNLISLCDRSLDIALDAGSMKALNAKATQQHGELSGSLASIQRTVELLKGTSELNIAGVEDFAVRYRRQVAAREGIITPPALDGTRQVPIDDLYVPARLGPLISKDEAPPWSYDFFVGQIFRGVILGNPGSGKSTLAKKLVTDLARDRLATPKRPFGLVPFLVTLRDFAAHKQDRPSSIVDFLTITSNSRYQIPTSTAVIEYLLLTNRAFVVFDGLDELLDTRDRAEISGDVASFASLYPATPILVTSREVGYLEAPLPEKPFPTYRLAGFGRNEAEEYARKWFRLTDGGQTSSSDAEVATFMRDSEGVADLRTNALLLGLMCNLYKGSGYIPRNRPDVYEACAEMLFDRWDRLRQIGKPLTIESLMRPTMQHLAFWIYGDGELQSGVTERALVGEAAAYLHERRFDDIDDARLAARRFIEHCRGRAWVFTDTGTTGPGERLYQFTHRTFLEFFTAGHLVRTNPSPGQLLHTLRPYISEQEWDVVAQLCFQLLERNVDGAANEMLGEIAAEPPNLSDGGRVNRLDFAVRCLEFLVPSPQLTRELTRNTLDLFKEWTKRTKGSGGNRSIDMVISLARVSPENAVPVLEAFAEGVAELLDNPPQAIYAAELVANFRSIVALKGLGEAEIADRMTARVIELSRDSLLELGMSDAALGADLVAAGVMDCETFIAHHGLEALFERRKYRVLPGIKGPSLGEIILASLLRGGGELDEVQARAALAAVAGWLSSVAPPWYSTFWQGPRWLFEPWSSPIPPRVNGIDDLSVDERFAALALAAVYLDEVAASTSNDGLASLLRELALEDGCPAWATVLSILRAWLENAPEIALTNLLSLGLTQPQEQVLESWLQHHSSLVSLERDREPNRDTKDEAG